MTEGGRRAASAEELALADEELRAARFEAATSRLVTRLQKYREEADYSRSFVIDEAGVREELEAAQALIERIRVEIGRSLA
ncbi:MAG TPA: hypothetical protein VNB06_21470 [Thermoanaerobaculia bacterium]|nr:hypothetical protein [Thermoanaerobaculia bacterium]